MVHVFILAHGQRRHGTGGIYFSLPVNDQCLGLCLFDLHRQIDETAHKGKGQQYAIADGETDGQSDCIIRRLKLGQVHGLLTLGYR